MKRFINLSGQVTLGPDRYFAWLDTSTDAFETHGDSQYWKSWEDFVEDYEGTELDRYKRIADHWVFGHAELEFPQVSPAEAVKLATLWTTLDSLKRLIDNTAVPLGHHLGIEDPNLMIALEELSGRIGAHFSKFKLTAEPRKFAKQDTRQ
jgi:hypothetical protein